MAKKQSSHQFRGGLSILKNSIIKQREFREAFF